MEEEPTIADEVLPVTTIESTPAATEPQGEACDEVWVSVYPYSSEELGDLIFDAGEMIRVVAKAGDWLTGVLGDRTGVFPFNYVEPVPQGEVASTALVQQVVNENYIKFFS